MQQARQRVCIHGGAAAYAGAVAYEVNHLLLHAAAIKIDGERDAAEEHDGSTKSFVHLVRTSPVKIGYTSKSRGVATKYSLIDEVTHNGASVDLAELLNAVQAVGGSAQVMSPLWQTSLCAIPDRLIMHTTGFCTSTHV